jgi:hypothetical protein
MQAITTHGQIIPQEIFLEFIKELVRARRPISNRSFAIIFSARAIKAAKISGWLKDAVGLFYKENTIQVVVPSGLGGWGYDQKFIHCPGTEGHVHHLNDFKKCAEYGNPYPAAGVARKIRNLEVVLSCYLDSNNHRDLTLPIMFGSIDRALGSFFTLKNPRFDQQGMNMPPVVRYTRTAWKEDFENLDNLKVFLDVGMELGTGTLCLAQAPNNGQLSQLDQLKATAQHVYVKL